MMSVVDEESLYHRWQRRFTLPPKVRDSEVIPASVMMSSGAHDIMLLHVCTAAHPCLNELLCCLSRSNAPQGKVSESSGKKEFFPLAASELDASSLIPF